MKEDKVKDIYRKQLGTVRSHSKYIPENVLNRLNKLLEYVKPKENNSSKQTTVTNITVFATYSNVLLLFF
jgi:hypothetical protein